MKAYDYRTFYLDSRNYSGEIVELPSDLMVYVSREKHLAHSSSADKWYVYCETLRPDNDNEIYYNLLCSGSWLDCAIHIFPDYTEVPFLWGDPIKSKISQYTTYVPFFEDVETERTDSEGFPIWEQHYKILTRMSVPGTTLAQTNCSTSFDIEDFGTELIGMVASLQHKTGKVF